MGSASEREGPVLRTRAHGPDAPPSDAIGEMVDGTLGGVIVRAALGAELVASLASRLEKSGAPLEESPWPAHFRTHSLGGTLDLTGDDLGAHFAAAARFRTGLASVLPGLEPTIQSLLCRFGGGRPVRPAASLDGRSLYVPATFKLVAPNGFIPPHVELEQLERRPYVELKTQITTRTLLSWFFVLAPAVAGGALRVSGLTWDRLDKSKMRDERSHDAIVPVLHEHPHEDLDLEAGDLAIFDGGRHVHQVTPVSGDRIRITVGGFAAPTADGSAILYWG